MKKIIIILMFLSYSFAVYNVGQTVSISDQNVVLDVCDQTTEYNVGDEIRLADWNGELNGGNYSVIFIDMSASW